MWCYMLNLFIFSEFVACLISFWNWVCVLPIFLFPQLFFFYSSSQQNLMLVNLLASQNIPQARKLMLNDGMTKLGGVNALNPALYYKYLVLCDNILKLCILIKVWLISTCGIISYVKDIIILGFYNYCFG